MSQKPPPERDRAYRSLVDGYYGAKPRLVPPAARRWLPESAEDLLHGYYGKPHRRRPHEKSCPPGAHSARAGAPALLTRAFDTGETLAGDAAPVFEEYVVERAMSDEFEPEEYVVERFPAGSAGVASSAVSGSESLNFANPEAERAVEICPPDASARAANSRSGRQDRAARAMGLDGSSDTDAATGDFADADVDADLQAILTGQSVFDPVQKRVVPRAETMSEAKRAAPPPPGENAQAIFDKIAESMRYANTFDLGTVELANRFDAFDRMAETETLRAPKPPPAPKQPAPPFAEAELSTQDFLEDIDKLRQDALAQASPSADPGRTGLPDYAQDYAFDASDGAPLTGEFVAGALQYAFASAAEIDDYFKPMNPGGFIDWFNEKAARNGPWAGKALPANAATRTNFKNAWDRIARMFGAPPINLFQFLSLMSAMINEVGDFNLGPVAEGMGRHGHPGLAYAFDRIAGVKGSYNVDGSNWTALRCFQDADFIAAHGQKPMGAQLQNSQDERWAGWVYPADAPTSTDPAITGFIGEADFYKFRGRGLIQTTWREGYRKLASYVQTYQGAEPEILSRAAAWANLPLDKIATISSNDDWDALFMRTNLEIPCVAVAKHSAAKGNYLNLSSNVDTLNGKGPGSIWNVGRQLNGAAYADKLQSRVFALCALLGNG